MVNNMNKNINENNTGATLRSILSTVECKDCLCFEKCRKWFILMM